MSQNAQRELDLLQQIASVASGLGQSGIPGYDTITFPSYSGTNPTSILFKNGSTTVATLTLAYDGSNNITSITKT